MSHAVKLNLRYTIFDRTNGLYLYQRAVPEGAIWLLQRKKITVSLGKTVHEAMARYPEVHAKWQAAIDRAIESVRGEPDDEEFVDRVVVFLNAQAALAGGTLPEIDWTLNWLERDRLWARWQEWNVTRDQTRTGDALAGDNQDVLDRLVEGWKIFRAAFRARVELRAQLAVPLSTSQAPTRDGQIIMSLDEVRVKWEKERKRSVASKNDTKFMVDLFVATCGNLPVHEINASHRMALREVVQELKTRSRGKPRPMKAQSRNKLMRCLAGLGSYAEGVGVTSNPLRFKAFSVTDETVREGFEDSHLKQVFESKAWKVRSPKYRNFILWFFRIGAYTGARIGMIAQLRAEDVFERDGVWVIRFTYDGDEVVDGRQSKTRQIIVVPVADQLIKWGLLDLVEKRRGGQLFPEIKPDSNGQWSGRVSDKVSKVLRGAGLPKEFVGHSWRHTLIERLRGKAEDSIVKMITHPPKSKGSVWARYGRAEIATMQKAVNLLNYMVE